MVLPPQRVSLTRLARTGLLILLAAVGGCTSMQEWVRNGFKVGPNFEDPGAEPASDWIDQDPHLIRAPAESGDWWNAFHDPSLSRLIETAYRQNLDLRTAAARVLQAQAQRNISAGNIFPQSQNLIGDYARVQIGSGSLFGGVPLPLSTAFSVWAVGPNASWELDFWGRLRRAVESSDASLYSSVDAYRDALVTLVADVATSYVQIRTYQKRIAYARSNERIQLGSLRLAEARLRDGKATELDVEQALVNLTQVQSSIQPLNIGLRQASDKLCVLLGQSPRDLEAELKIGPIPRAAADLAVGIPADLLTRRPDVRRALKDVAAQCAQIGIAQADFYPRVAVSGFIGYTADDLRFLFESGSFTAYVLPNFQWKILNYGRILNNVRLQEARLEEKTNQYRQSVLSAGREVEDALAGFVQSHQQAEILKKGEVAAKHSAELVQYQYQQGKVDFNRVFTTQAALVTQQDQLAVAEGNIALNLIAVYRALGGGWQYFDRQHGAPVLQAPQPITPEEPNPRQPDGQAMSRQHAAPLGDPMSDPAVRRDLSYSFGPAIATEQGKSP